MMSVTFSLFTGKCRKSCVFVFFSEFIWSLCGPYRRYNFCGRTMCIKLNVIPASRSRQSLTLYRQFLWFMWHMWSRGDRPLYWHLSYTDVCVPDLCNSDGRSGCLCVTVGTSEFRRPIVSLSARAFNLFDGAKFPLQGRDFRFSMWLDSYCFKCVIFCCAL